MNEEWGDGKGKKRIMSKLELSGRTKRKIDGKLVDLDYRISG